MNKGDCEIRHKCEAALRCRKRSEITHTADETQVAAELMLYSGRNKLSNHNNDNNKSDKYYK